MEDIMRVVAQVYETDDYAKFRKLENNRDVLSNRLNKLIASFSEKSILNPIVVNKYWEIIDGQGRYEARKSMGLPIQFVIDEDADIDDCRRMNKYNTSWKYIDFAKSYADGGKMPYVWLLKTVELSGLSITRVMRLSNHAAHGNVKNNTLSSIADGNLLFKESDIETVCALKQKADEISEALAFIKERNDAFYVAVKVVCETNGYDHNRMLMNCKKCRSNYSQMAGIEDQLKEFSRIYNYSRSASKLYFEDYMRNKGRNVRDYSTASYYSEKNISTLKNKEINNETI